MRIGMRSQLRIKIRNSCEPAKDETFIFSRFRIYQYIVVPVLHLAEIVFHEDEEFLLSAAEKYGAKGAKQAQALVDEVSGLFADGNIADEDLDVMMKALQDAYWIAKEKNKKFTPKKYRRD